MERTIDPRTEEVIANIEKGDKEDVDLAIKGAHEAFDHGPWPRLSGSERGRIMMKFLQLAEENIEELATLDALNAGKYYAGAVDKIHEKTLRMANQLQGHTLHEPIGVVGHIIPWYFPIGMFLMKTSLALAAG
ncbi:aldehyde dehydrogenase family 2 member C4-like protein [Tanacetum coccineum]